jgi:hypothetical protein
MATFRILVVILRVKCVLYPAGTGLLVLYRTVVIAGGANGFSPVVVSPNL